METSFSIAMLMHPNKDHAPSGFEAEDILPVAIRKTESDAMAHKAMIQTAVVEDRGLDRPDQRYPEDNLQLHIWKKLIDIDQKLNFLLEKLVLKPENGLEAPQCRVSLSETELRLITTMELISGETVELRLLVPLKPPAWLILYGMVTRVDILDQVNRDVTVVFSNMDDDVRQMIRYYRLNRQRELIRNMKKYGE